MNRREMLKQSLAVPAGLVAPGILDPGHEGCIKGVGVLRYPSERCHRQSGEKTIRDMAKELADQIRPGCILAFPSDTDEHGNFLWDFRIEEGDPGQVQIVRNGQTF